MCVQWNEPVTVPLIVAEELEHELFEDEEADENAALMHKVKGHHATPIARQMSAMSSHSNDVIDGKAETDEVSQIRSLKFRFSLSLSLPPSLYISSFFLYLYLPLSFTTLSLSLLTMYPFRHIFFHPRKRQRLTFPWPPSVRSWRWTHPSGCT